jgi:hypothetical protein
MEDPRHKQRGILDSDKKEVETHSQPQAVWNALLVFKCRNKPAEENSREWKPFDTSSFFLILNVSAFLSDDTIWHQN